MRAASTVSARIVACCAAALALFGCSAGCSAGQITQTDSQVAAVEGSFGDVGNIALRNALIPYPQNREGAYPPGSAVPVLLAIINQGNVTDQLIAVTSPAASQVLLLGTTQLPPGSTVTSIAGPFVTSEPTSPLVVGQLRIVLITNQVLHAGLNTPVTFQFRNAGNITLAVPMGSAHSES
ncbi:MAG: hypothetical protein ACRDRG_10935 [Pseudonocardiaceae bacterium]